MKRLLLGLLLICTLTSSLAWAWDSHGQMTIDPSGSNHDFVSLDSDEPSGSAAQDCHYAGCGLAHVVGFLGTATSITAASSSESFSDVPTILVSQNILPPLKPPRS